MRGLEGIGLSELHDSASGLDDYVDRGLKLPRSIEMHKTLIFINVLHPIIQDKRNS